MTRTARCDRLRVAGRALAVMLALVAGAVAAQEPLPQAAAVVIQKALPVSSWLWKWPRTNPDSVAVGHLGPGAKGGEYLVAEVNFLDRRNVNRDALVLLQRVAGATPARYRLLDRSPLWLSRAGLSDARNYALPPFSVHELMGDESVRIARGYVWLDIAADTGSCDQASVTDPCFAYTGSFQFRLARQHLVLIGHDLKVWRHTAPVGAEVTRGAPMYSCSINYLTRQRITVSRGFDVREQHTDDIDVRPVALRDFAPYGEKYGAGGMPAAYLCDFILPAPETAPATPSS